MSKLIPLTLFATVLLSACSPGSDPPVEQAGHRDPASNTSALSGGVSDGVEYYDNNIFSIGFFTATADQCDDEFAGTDPDSILSYWEAIDQTSCYQEGAVALTPPLFDCSDGVAPEGPPGRDAIAGTRIVFDLRTLEIKVTSHVVDFCIPIE